MSKASQLLNGNTGQLFALLLGYSAGQIAAWWLSGFDFSTPADLQAARDMGLVSRPLMVGYAKVRDVHSYLFSLLMPIIFSLLAWRLVRPKSSIASGIFTGDFSVHGYVPKLLALLMVLAFIQQWNLSFMYAPSWNQAVRGWPFLGEHGATLAWLQSLRGGGVYGRDFFALYGPMYIYPLSWLMDVTGNQTAQMDRYYKVILQLIAYAAMFYCLLRTLRNRAIAIAMGFLMIALYPMLWSSASNSNVLRGTLAIFVLLCITLWIDTRKKRWLWIGGLSMGQSILFSQEAGASALIATSAVLLLQGWTQRKSFGDAIKQTGAFWLITLLSIAPMAIYLVANGAGPAALDALVGYPKEVMLGFAGLLFPSFRDLFSGANLRNYGMGYVVIAIYSISVVVLVLAWFGKVRTSRFYWAMGLTICGIILFRQALGRSAPDQTIRAMLPSLFLIAFWLDEIWHTLRNPESGRSRILPTLSGGILLLMLIVGIILDPASSQRIELTWNNTILVDGKFSIPDHGRTINVHPRSGFQIDNETWQSIHEIDDFLSKNTKPGEPVLFFPNEAAYYYIFDRPSPTRYPVSYFAAAYHRQREYIADLEKLKPRFIIISKGTWRVDDIAENIMLPLIFNYVIDKYKPYVGGPTIEVWFRAKY